jgi:hypothetical protein
MKITRTPAPYPSTIISLDPAESFPYPTSDPFQVQAITVFPAETVFSGPASPAQDSLRTHTIPASDPEQVLAAVPFSPAQDAIRPALRAALRAHARTSAPAPAQPAQHTHLADPSGPDPTPAQQDSISRSAARTSSRPPAQPQHLAAVPAPARKGAHRAGR